MIQVLVVEDSLVQRTLLVGILSADSEITVVGAVTSGAEALAFLARQKPDVVTMDLRMPDMNGLEATRQIMETTPLPIVIVSEYWDTEGTDMTFRALEAGAVAGVSKPIAAGLPNSAEIAQQIKQTVKLMSEVRVIRRWPRSRRPEQLTLLSTSPTSATRLSSLPAPVVAPPPRPREISVVAIGASTGGPPVLRTILAGLPRAFPVPVLIVQHIAKGFTPSLVQWLQNEASPLIHLAKQGDEMLPGHIYIAPDDLQMGVALNKRIALTLDPVEHSLRPSVSYLFRSLASVYGGQVIAVLLTGMGKDGAQDLRHLRDQGAITIAQNKETSVVHGMPGVAIALDAAMHILAPDDIAPLLVSLTQPSPSHGSVPAGGF